MCVHTNAIGADRIFANLKGVYFMNEYLDLFKSAKKRLKGNVPFILTIVLIPVVFFAFIFGFAYMMQTNAPVAISGLGVLLLSITILAIVRTTKCNEPVTAVFKGHSLTGNNWQYALVFSYKYEDKQYENRETIDHYSKRKIKKMFEENNEYTIWINPNKPERCVYNKKRDVLTFCITILFCIACIVIGFYLKGV